MKLEKKNGNTIYMTDNKIITSSNTVFRQVM